MTLYVNGASAISPQKTFDPRDFLTEVTAQPGPMLTCVLPDFSAFFSAAKLRRLSRMLKMGLTAATICLAEAGASRPDAVITATGYGFQDDLRRFLGDLIDQQEEQLTPTLFTQSTYNALSGMIAMTTGATGYNSTHVGRGFAFENALDDAALLLEDSGIEQVLIEAFDETSPIQYTEYLRRGYLKEPPVRHPGLFETDTPGTLLGEGVACFSLSATQQSGSLCRIRDWRLVYRPAGDEELNATLTNLLSQNGYAPDRIDVFIDGASGDAIRDRWNRDIRQRLFGHASHVRFKHLTGEYTTAAAFALWLGAMILKHRHIPEAVCASDVPPVYGIKSALICNHFLARYYSFILIESV